MFISFASYLTVLAPMNHTDFAVAISTFSVSRKRELNFNAEKNTETLNWLGVLLLTCFILEQKISKK